MSKQTEAMKLALEAFEEIASWYIHDRSVGSLASSMYEASCLAKVQATALRTAIEAAERQEPFGYISEHNCEGPFQFQFHRVTATVYWDNCKTVTPVYTTPPAAQPAAPEDWRDLVLMALPNYVPREDWLLSPGASVMSEDSHEMVHWDTIEKIVKAVAAPPAAPVQEPLEYWNAVEGWVKIDEVRQHFDSVGCGTIYKNAGEDRVPLYTAAKRQWVGLTDEDLREINGRYLTCDARLRAADRLLREKNGGNA